MQDLKIKYEKKNGYVATKLEKLKDTAVNICTYNI